ncbi:tetratricopeptide repeat protein [Rhizobium paknamense]|uniref:Tetratricopeptide (TPR) repeat protein n=1 Tax=Rhizobium paknamense TaxID=1206817 RepID=A0ABU0ID59_9HYPH|nr:tetratricopeptide repeat protein [Rhizobium paknamense]MDQ0456179.1 tetratricopeptide (TPR) repeat protein [Rhizobium paknamense]
MTDELLLDAFEKHRAGALADAALLYEQILAEDPDQVDALRLLASARRSLGQLPEALSLYARALRLAPDHADIWFNLGNALSAAGREADALESYRRAAELQPQNAEAHAHIGICLANRNDLAGAADAYRTALALDPQNRIAIHNLGNVLSEMGEAEAAIRQLRQAVSLYPDLAEAHYNLGLNLLRAGDFAGGFKAYEWRWRAEGFPATARHTEITDWDGRPFPGKRLLVHAEQGLGDTIQFVKLLPLVKSLGGEVILQVPDKLLRLLRDVAGADRVQSADPEPGEVDYQVPLLGVPHRLQLTLGSIPGAKAYLAADPDSVARWRQKLALGNDRPVFGFVWRGNPLSPSDKGRSLKGPEALKPFAGLGHARLMALQKLEPEEIEPADTPSGYRVAGLDFTLEYPGPDFDAGPDAFIDTAAILSQLSGFVSVCTAPLHLAGALGVPSLALLKAVPDWRWGLREKTSPWYPAMRLFRQPEPGDFASAIAEAVGYFRAFPGKVGTGFPSGNA